MKYYNGKFSGKGNTAIGRMCAYTLNGVNVFRSIPSEVKVSNSTPSIGARKRFSALSQIIKNMTPVISMHTMPQAPGENYRNPATTLNSPAVTLNIANEAVTDPTLFVFAKGGFAGQPATGTFDSVGKVYSVTWTASTQVGASPDDSVYVVLVNKFAELLSSLEEDARSRESLEYDTTPIPSGTSVYAFLFVKSSRSGSWSNSAYLGTFTA